MAPACELQVLHHATVTLQQEEIKLIHEIVADQDNDVLLLLCWFAFS